MHEYSIGGGGHIEVVVGLNSEVPHPAVAAGERVSAGNGDSDVGGWGTQLGAIAEGAGAGPSLGGLVPEGVAGGGVDDCGAVGGVDGEVVQVGVVVDPDG